MKTRTQEAPRPRPEKAAYQAERRARSATLYFPTLAEMERFHALAQAGGYGRNFSAWCRLMLHHATSGHLYPPDYVEGLKRDIERLRGYYETARNEAEDHRAQVKQLQGQLQTALVLLAGLPSGQELAQRFLSENGAAQEASA